MSRALFLLYLLLVAPAWGVEKVVLQLKWKHQFQFAGYYAAVEKGFYREAGLEVELRELQQDTDVIHEVVKGDAQFGIGTSDLVLARVAGKPVVALAVILQHSPLVLLARKDGNRVIQNLVGKRLMVAPGEAELFAYLKQEGVPDSGYQLLPHTFEPSGLLSGQVDAMSGYSTDEPFSLRRAGFAYDLYSPRSAGVDFYGDNLFTSEELLKERPVMVNLFREATLRGWRYAMEHPEEMADLILARYSQRHSREHLLFEAAEMNNLMQPALVEIGHMNPGRWRHIADIYANLGMLPDNASIDGLIYDVRPAKLPSWASAGFLVGIVVLVLVGAVAWRFAYFNRALNAEILARKEAEQVARASAENFRRLMDVAPVPVVVTSRDDSRVLYLNEHALQEFARPGQRDSIIGSRVPDYYANPAQREKLLSELEAHGFVREMPVAVRNARGEIVDVLVSARHIDFEGMPAVYAIPIDITERSRAEAAVRESEAKALDANARLRRELHKVEELQTALKEQAIRDSLTGLFNRRYLDETLARELARATREQCSLCVVMLDIDLFKRLNDTYGHQMGDEALRRVADTLRQHVRLEDVVCRYGGEEFLILLPGISLQAAAERAEDWRARIEAIRLESENEEIRLTASMGVAAYPDHGVTPDQLTRNADLALYLAKRGGRNRVEVYRQLEEDPITGIA